MEILLVEKLGVLLDCWLEYELEIVLVFRLVLLLELSMDHEKDDLLELQLEYDLVAC